MSEIDFWYSIGSTYSYLTVARIEDAATAEGVKVRWCPFNVRHVMIVQNNIPFQDKPEKTAYLWRDIERRSVRSGLKPQVPAPYPITDLELANKVAMVGVKQGWVGDYTRATYRLWFESGDPAGEDPNLSASLREIGCDPSEVLAMAQSEAISQGLADRTDEAMALGVFGSPSFVVKGEVFWGDDRLEDALAWAK